MDSMSGWRWHQRGAAVGGLGRQSRGRLSRGLCQTCRRDAGNSIGTDGSVCEIVNRCSAVNTQR